MKTHHFKAVMKYAFLLECLTQLTKLAETNSSKQTIIKILALGIDSLGIQSLKALIVQWAQLRAKIPKRRNLLL